MKDQFLFIRSGETFVVRAGNQGEARGIAKRHFGSLDNVSIRKLTDGEKAKIEFEEQPDTTEGTTAEGQGGDGDDEGGSETEVGTV